MTNPMPHPTLLRLARRWKPAQGDDYGADKRRLLDFMLENNITSSNPKQIGWILGNVEFSRHYTRNQFQHQLLVPLRNESTIFIGSTSAGVFLVTSPLDADEALGFYSARVRAEQRHSRNLRKLAKRTKLFEGYTSVVGKTKKGKPRPRSIIFMDESGTPSVIDLTPPVFVVAAVLIDSRLELSNLEQRFKHAAAIVGRPPDQELRTAGLSVAKHRLALRELSLIDYQWAAACFVKPQLSGYGFADPVTFYRYAFQFLVGDLLALGWESDLIIDEYSNDAFQQQLEIYLRRQNSGLPINRLDQVTFHQSSKDRLVQLADLVAGAIRRSTEGDAGPLLQIDDKRINLQFFPDV